MRTAKGKFKERKRILSINECLIYQIIESCLKFDLDRSTSLNVINLILKHYSYLLMGNNKIITIQKMDYRNYRRYVNELMGMSPLHQEYFKQYDTSDPNGTDRILSKEKTKDIRQLENLLFLLSENNESLPYKKFKIVDTDDLVFRALIQLDKSYTF
jgi:hypothetical protein